MDRTGNHVLSMARLAKDVLAEIPDQFISYMKSRGIKPNPAPPPYTPPGHTHHHTQIWSCSLSFSLRTNNIQQPIKNPVGTLCLLQTGANTPGNGCCVSCPYPLSDSWSSVLLVSTVFFVFPVSYLFGRFLLKRDCKLSRSKSLYSTLGQWLFDVWFDSRLVQKGHVVV